MLREMNRQYYHQTVTTKTIEDFMSAQLELDLTLIFDQYLRSTKPPVLQIKQSKKGTKYRWYKPIKGFNMPLLVNQAKLPCTQKWAFCAGKEFKLNANQYYLMYKKNK
jgi:aminopeptidase N